MGNTMKQQQELVRRTGANTRRNTHRNWTWLTLGGVEHRGSVPTYTRG